MLKPNRWGITFLFLGMILCQTDDQIFVDHIYFIGNHSLRKSLLEQHIHLEESILFSKTKFDKRILKLDGLTIKNFYQSKGFLGTTVRDSFAIIDGKADVYFIVNEGERTFVKYIDLKGNTLISDKIIMDILKLKKGKPLNPVALKMNIKLIEEKYHHLGKLFVKINIGQTVTDSASISIEVNEGPYVHVKNKYIEGADSSDYPYIQRELIISSNDLYDLEKLQKSQRQLLETGQYSFVNIYPVRYLQSDSLVNLVTEVRYFPKREISSEGGFVPIEFGGLTLSGPGAFVQWKNRSLFGTNVRLSTKSSLEIPTEEGLRYPRFSMDINLENQWLLGVRFPTKIQTLYELYKKYGASDEPFIRRYGFNWSTINRLSETSFIKFGMRWEKFNQKNNDTKDVEQRMISLKTKLDYSDHPVFPTRGIILTGDIYSVGGLLGGNRDYQKVDGGLQTYIPVTRKITFATQMKFGIMFNWDSTYNEFEEILLEKFYLGGTKTMRGWKALQFPKHRTAPNIFLNGNEIRFLVNGELRFPIIGNYGGELFIDGGQLWGTTKDVNLYDLLWDVGAGITYKSPLGPIRLEYAYQIENPSSWEILLDVLYAF
ncbi:MAG: outer membrane protein assembly factor [Fidelibacterota bacterium]